MNLANASGANKRRDVVQDYLINSVTGTFPLNEKFPFDQFDWTKATILNPSENLMHSSGEAEMRENIPEPLIDAYIVVINNYSNLLTTIMKSKEIEELEQSSSFRVIGVYNLTSLTYIPAPPMQELISLPENARAEYIINRLNSTGISSSKRPLN